MITVTIIISLSCHCWRITSKIASTQFNPERSSSMSFLPVLQFRPSVHLVFGLPLPLCSILGTIRLLFWLICCLALVPCDQLNYSSVLLPFGWRLWLWFFLWWLHSDLSFRLMFRRLCSTLLCVTAYFLYYCFTSTHVSAPYVSDCKMMMSMIHLFRLFGMFLSFKKRLYRPNLFHPAFTLRLTSKSVSFFGANTFPRYLYFFTSSSFSIHCDPSPMLSLCNIIAYDFFLLFVNFHSIFFPSSFS